MWEYSIGRGWKEIADLLSEASSSADFEEQLDAAGYSSDPSSVLGQQFTDFYAEVYGPKEIAEGARPYKFLVLIELHDIAETVAIPDFPDLIEFLSKISSISHAAMIRSGLDQESDEESEEE